MPIFVGETDAMIAFARKVWGIEPSKSKKTTTTKSKPKKPRKESHPKGMP